LVYFYSLDHFVDIQNAYYELESFEEFEKKVTSNRYVGTMLPEAQFTLTIYEELTRKIQDVLMEPRAKTIAQEAHNNNYQTRDFGDVQLCTILECMNKQSWLKHVNRPTLCRMVQAQLRILNKGGSSAW